MPADTVTLSCARIGRADLTVIDRLARICLGIKRGHSDLLLAQAGDELIALIDFAGLGEVLRVQVQREPEEREEPGGVQEEGELGDPPV